MMTKQPIRKYKYDVFLSHNSIDKWSVETLAAKLQDEAGLIPFLDKWHLIPGEPWQEALEEALDSSATCAVFLGPSGLGPWENEEMRSALDDRVRNKSFRVIPVLLPGANPKDPAALPRFLRRVTWVDFRSGLDDPEAFRHLVAGIGGKAPGRGIIASVSRNRLKPTFIYLLTSTLKHIYPLLLLILPTLVVFVVVLALINWRIPTRVQMDLTVDRTVFTVGGTDSTLILNSVPFQSITVEKFAHIEFSPEKLEVADPAQYILIEDRYPGSAWTSLTITRPVVITGEEEMLQPAITLENAKPGSNTAGTLDQVWARPGSEVTLEVVGVQKVNLNIQVDGKKSLAALSFHGLFRLITNYGRVSGITRLPYQADSLTYRAELPNYSPIIEITGQPNSLMFVLTISPEKIINLLPKRNGIPVKALDFTRQNLKGDPETTLVKDGKISYPDYPKIEKVTFKAPDFIGLDKLEKFRIEEIALAPEHNGIRLRLNGIAGHVRTGSPEFPKDHRLTCFDVLWQNLQLMVLLSIIVWVFPTTVGVYRLYKEVKG